MIPFSLIHASASASFSDGQLVVSTGSVARCWCLAETGLLTTSFRHESSARDWISVPAAPRRADWDLNALTAPGSTAILLSLDAAVVEEPLAHDSYLHVRAVFGYPAWHAEALYEIRAYPGAPGLWTRLSVRLTQPVEKMLLPLWPLGSFAESLFLETQPCARTAIGHYNDTQHRNHDDLTLLREEPLPGFGKRQIVDWANFLCLERDGEGLALLKESHKCANQPGIDTGAFVLHPDEVLVTGLGLKSNNYQGGPWLRPGDFRPCWANWSILYSGGPIERQRAIKTFDRRRFPFIPARDEKILENTWGTRGSWEGGAPEAAESQNILREIACCADLGIDVVQIDHGWALYHNNTSPEAPWSLCPEKYPQGWAPVVEAAKKHGVELGLWFSWQAPVSKMIEHYRAGGLRRFKIDFINLQDPDRVERDVSNAWRHRMDYLFATTMMGVPLFFFETQFLAARRRAELKPIVATYKKHCDALHAGTVYPIGAEPDDHSWTGFQSVLSDDRSGYLTLFREIDNPEHAHELALAFLGAATALRLTNLMTGETTIAPVAPGGRVAFIIPEPGDYRFLHYELALGPI